MNKNIKYLIESIQGFDIIDYDEPSDTVLSQSSIQNYLYNEFPQSKFNLMQLVAARLKDNIENPYLLDIDTSNIQSMNSLFSALRTDYLANSYGIDMRRCVRLDLSRWNLQNVYDMSNMFYKCTGLEEINMDDCNLSNVYLLNNMFYGCKNLKTLNGFTIKIDNDTVHEYGKQQRDKAFFQCKKSIIPLDFLHTMNSYELENMQND